MQRDAELVRTTRRLSIQGWCDMPIAPDRLDKFTFQAGQFHPITDLEENARIDKEIGFTPPSDEEWAWVSAQWKKRWRNEPGLSTDKLQDEYAKLKAQGKTPKHR